ncbi:MAG: LegC family aminotransferase [Bacteroidales bacterium]
MIDFIKSLYSDKPVIALHEPSFSGNEKKYMAECIDSTYVSSVGPFVGRFEEAVAKFVGQGRGPAASLSAEGGGPRAGLGAKEGGPRFRGDDTSIDVKAVACVNGTAALHLALMVAGVKAGDEVITQPLSFIATANPIVYLGAKPIFIDVDSDTLGMSPIALRAFLESRFGREAKHVKRGAKRIAACVPMHTFGNPCRIDEIVEVCNEYGIPVIEDAAESIGSYYKGQHTGTFGLMGVLSFNGNKTITTGGGGMIVTRDAKLVTRLKHLSTQAKIPHPWEFAHDAIGYNYRLPNINAALGLAQMETIESKLESKRLLAKKYADFFAEMGIPTIQEIPGVRSNFWLNGMFLENSQQRNEFLQLAVSQNVHCRPTWELLPTLEMYKQYQCEDITNAKLISDTLVNIPSSPVFV